MTYRYRYRDSELLNSSPSNDGRRIFLPGGDLFFLSVSDGKKESDSGTYWCIARNQVGNVRSRNATLQVGGKETERHLQFTVYSLTKPLFTIYHLLLQKASL